MNPTTPSQEPSQTPPGSPPPLPTTAPQIPPVTGGLHLAPLSSEEDIRRAAEANAPVPPTPQPVQPFSPDTPQAILGESQNQPVAPSPQSATHMSTAGEQSGASPVLEMIPVHPRRKRIIWSVVILLTLMLIVAGLYFLFPSAFKLPIGVNDLIEEKTMNTSFERPKHWKALPARATTYGDGIIGSDKATALVIVSEQGRNPLLINASEAFLTLLREQTLRSTSVETVRGSFGPGGSRCRSEIDFSSKIDTRVHNNTTGIVALEASCNTYSGEFIVKMRTVLGDDGRLRVIGVAGSGIEWSRSEAAFTQILQSIGQSEAASI